MRFMNVSTARQELTQLLDRLDERVTIIGKGGQPVAVLLSFEDFRVLRAAQTLLRQPNLVRRMHEEQELLATDNAERFAEVEEVFKRRASQKAVKASAQVG